MLTFVVSFYSPAGKLFAKKTLPSNTDYMKVVSCLEKAESKLSWKT